jgi:hypothetical protein
MPQEPRRYAATATQVRDVHQRQRRFWFYTHGKADPGGTPQPTESQTAARGGADTVSGAVCGGAALADV